MKILMLLLVIFYSQSLFAKVYYCIEEDSIGYDGADNYKIVNFQKERFTADIDFKNTSIIAHDIMLDSSLLTHSCAKGADDTIMQCMNGWGYSFSINVKNLKFVISRGYSYVDDSPTDDDLALSYGKCELF